MGAYTGIEWTDASLNPWEGCTKASPGCKLCYAWRQNKRYGKDDWGPKGDRRLIKSYPQILREIQKRYERGEESRNGTKQLMVFVGDICDIFEHPGTMPEHSIEPTRQALTRLWADIETNPHLIFQLLTKRPENVHEMVPAHWMANGFPPNVWLGTSAENDEWLIRRAPHLLSLPVAVKFLSYEPAKGPLPSLHRFLDVSHADEFEWSGTRNISGWLEPFGWVICGGESSDSNTDPASPMHPDWAREVRDACLGSRVPFFFKQWGDWAPDEALPNDFNKDYIKTCIPREYVNLKGELDGIGQDPGIRAMNRVGKQRAGSLLDGQGWSEFPKIVQAVTA